MRLLRATIEPKGFFGSAFRGDTLVGQLCWMIRFKEGNRRLNELLGPYKKGKPFVIVSDPFLHGYLPKPKMPRKLLGEGGDKKRNTKKIWLTLEQLQNGEYAKAQEERALVDTPRRSFATTRNRINYLKFTTDGKQFAPYGEEYFYPAQDLYLLVDEEQIEFEKLQELIEMVGGVGYGKDSTIGKGRFELVNFEAVKLQREVSNRFMTLLPCVADKEAKNWYEPFVRFGKHGYMRAGFNAFKRPYLLMNSAAVIEYEKPMRREFTGKAIADISLAYPDTIAQGYSILIPLKESE
ncbi:MAG: hypothetical protein GXO16_01835 [Epsilonproteobacteria bacterium]|nr:hypothetical protein [Campylobacterota bacterium]